MAKMKIYKFTKVQLENLRFLLKVIALHNEMIKNWAVAFAKQNMGKDIEGKVSYNIEKGEYTIIPPKKKDEHKSVQELGQESSRD